MVGLKVKRDLHPSTASERLNAAENHAIRVGALDGNIRGISHAVGSAAKDWIMLRLDVATSILGA